MGWLLIAVCGFSPAFGQPAKVRFATFNASLNRIQAGELLRDLAGRDNAQARQVAEIVQRVRPDVLLINEFDFDAAGQGAKLFQENYLSVSQNGQPPIEFRERFAAPSNTGVPSGLDLNGDGKADGPNDAFGFGRFPGQYGLVVFSRFSLNREQVRTFQKFHWKDMPQAMLPKDAAGKPYYSAAAMNALRLPSKSFWDLPFDVQGTTIHFLVSHPTPPVFDGPEDRNGCRNHDEIRLAADYVHLERSAYLYDDRGQRGGLPAGAKFVIAGDMNADPHDGDSTAGAILQLTRHPLIHAEPIPASRGGPEQSRLQGQVNLQHKGDPAHDTADFGAGNVGNLRVDYVLVSRTLSPLACGVFWPASDEAGHALVKSSDHRLVWADVQP